MKYDWEKCKDIFDVDGSLRDIYILHTTTEDWQKVLDALRSAGYTQRQDGHACEIPGDAHTIFELQSQDQWTMISIEEDGVTINCHFFCQEEIEFDLDPREIVSPAEFDTVLRFMQIISRATGKEAILTPENFQRYVMVRVVGDDIVFTGNW